MTEPVEKHPAFRRADALPDPVARLFPHSVEEAREWVAQPFWRALDRQVLVVAVPRIECGWRAYIGAVRGNNHREEYQRVMEQGATLPEPLARWLFPMFDAVPYAD